MGPATVTMSFMPLAMGQADGGIKLPERKDGESDAAYLKRVQAAVNAFNNKAKAEVVKKEEQKQLQDFQLTRKQPPTNPPRFAFNDSAVDLSKIKELDKEQEKTKQLLRQLSDAGHDVYRPNSRFFQYPDGTVLEKNSEEPTSRHWSGYRLFADIDKDGIPDAVKVYEKLGNKEGLYYIYSGAQRAMTLTDSVKDPTKRKNNIRECGKRL